MKRELRTIVWLTAVLCCGVWSFSVKGQQVINPYALQSGSTLSSVTPAEYERIANLYKANPNKGNRNQLIFMAVSQIDAHFMAYERKRRHRNNLFQTVMNILEVAAATAISVTNGERAKSLIADGLGFVQGSRDGINKNYRLLERQVLVNKMNEKRAIALKVIFDRIDQDINQYPFERAYIDLLTYFHAGTVDSALSALATDTGTSNNNAQQQLQNAKLNAGITLAPTAAQIQISRQNSNFVQNLVDIYDEQDRNIAAADVTIAAETATIAAQNARQPPNTPDAAVIADATQKKNEAEVKKREAQAKQKEVFDKLKAAFDSIEQDVLLSPLLDTLPQKYPNLAASINSRLARIRAGNGDINDYGLTLLKFFGVVTDAAISNPAVADRAKNIIDSVK